MNNDEIVKVEAYLRKLFKTEALELKRSPRQDMVEVLMDEEFIATLTKRNSTIYPTSTQIPSKMPSINQSL